MNLSCPSILSFLLSILLGFAALPARAAEEIDIQKTARGKALIPISIEGFSDEALNVLKFDLEVAGFKFVAPDQAQYNVAGSNNPNVQGRVTDRFNKASLVAKSYLDPSLRRQAHAFADDIVLAITKQKGIAQTKIAFKLDTGKASEIYIADYDGHNLQPVTQDGTIVAAPTWVPSRRMLYYTSYKLGNPDIYSHDLASGTRKIAARYSGLNTAAAISPDGARMAMILSKGGSPDVYVAAADGTNPKQLTKTKEDESSPCWSPDGRTICFVSRIDGARALCKIGADGGEVRRIRTAGISNPSEPDWSPDGKTIVFTAQMGGFEICTVAEEGGTATILVSGEDPSWAPNSRTVIFTRRLENHKRILSLLDVPTKQVKDISRISGSGNSSQPSWAK
jgi:TolB protein